MNEKPSTFARFAKPSTFGNSSSSNKTQFASGLNDKASKKSCWPDDPAIGQMIPQQWLLKGPERTTA